MLRYKIAEEPADTERTLNTMGRVYSLPAKLLFMPFVFKNDLLTPYVMRLRALKMLRGGHTYLRMIMINYEREIISYLLKASNLRIVFLITTDVM